jgi:hypothetical protein
MSTSRSARPGASPFAEATTSRVPAVRPATRRNFPPCCASTPFPGSTPRRLGTVLALRT